MKTGELVKTPGINILVSGGSGTTAPDLNAPCRWFATFEHCETAVCVCVSELHANSERIPEATLTDFKV